MDLSPNFTLAEFLVSDTAARKGIDNTPSPQIIEKLRVTSQLLERIRAHLSKAAGKDVGIRISSGYRCLILNREVGSSDTSDHCRGLAADWIAPKFGTPFEICQALLPHIDELDIGQMIYEHTWVHVSARRPDKQINRVLTVKGKGYRVGLHKTP
jgi:hypothetical protein